MDQGLSFGSKLRVGLAAKQHGTYFLTPRNFVILSNELKKPPPASMHTVQDLFKRKTHMLHMFMSHQAGRQTFERSHATSCSKKIETGARQCTSLEPNIKK